MKLKTEHGSNFFTLGEVEHVGENETREKWKEIYNTLHSEKHMTESVVCNMACWKCSKVGDRREREKLYSQLRQ